MTTENLKLEQDCYEAGKALAKAAPGAKAPENAYGAAYQALVKAGLRPQIKYKYRCQK